MTNVQIQCYKINTPPVKVQTNVSNFIITFSTVPSSALPPFFIPVHCFTLFSKSNVFLLSPFLVFLWMWTQRPLTWGVKVNPLWGNVVEMPGTEQVGRQPSQNSSEEQPGPQRESLPIESARSKKEKRTSPLRKDPLPKLPQEARGKRRLKLPARSSSLVRANSLAFSDCNILPNEAMFWQWSQI